MDRKKPTLTSPWKVGFLVALLLVVTAIGVSYFITGTFGVTWHWIHVGGLSPDTWTFNLGAFVEEMAPLLALTALLAFASYILVAGAVRRYKAYVDSGAEYKQILKSIKTIDDLESDDLTDRLKSHPELREFMMSVKHRVAAMERNQTDRERKQAPADSSAKADVMSRLSSECSALNEAIHAGRDGFPSEIALTIPELKALERSLRAFIISTPEPATTDPTAERALDDLRGSMRDAVSGLRRDLAACGAGAKEVETALQTVNAGLKSAPGRPADSAAEVQKRVDSIASALGTLGEETKRIAIAAALQASGGPEADAIKLAEELRTTATRFNAVAQHWRETAPALKAALGAAAPVSDGTAAAMAGVAKRVHLWSERLAAMNEHVHALERLSGDDSHTDVSSGLEVSGVADLDLDTSAPSAGDDTVAKSREDDFVTPKASDVLGSDAGDDAGFADIPGFEKERKFFSDASGQAQDADHHFEVDSTPERRWDLAEESPESEMADPASETSAPAATPAPSPVRAAAPAGDTDGFLTGPRPTVTPSSKQPDAPAKKSPAPAPKAPAPVPVQQTTREADTATATIEPDADAVDLYELGAIDCVQTM